MTKVGNLFPFILPFLVVSIASILLCFCLLLKKKRGEHDANMQMQVRGTSSSGDEVQEDGCFDRVPPRYSTTDYPPPYSLFDPKLTNVCPGGPPPPYEVHPVTLPLAPHWTSTEPLQPPSSPANQNHRNPPRSHRASFS